MFRARQRRRLRRKLDPKYRRFLKRVMDSKKGLAVGEKPKAIKTHLRDCIVLPQMINGLINIHTGNKFNQVEIKPEMIGYYLGEFSMTYKRVTHGKPGVGATHSSKFTPIK
jgi:small subunit ribosomal protein S15e